MQGQSLTIVTGNYGSGKTEVSLNLAVREKTAQRRVAIADLDIVNPYFRTADARAELDALGIDLIAPLYANTNVDIPALPADMARCFSGQYDAAVLDVGGDPEGAIALGRYRAEIEKTGYEMLFVVNLNRPDTRTAADILSLMREVEHTSRLRVTGLVNNTNLLAQSDAGQLLAAGDVLREVSQGTGVPLRWTAGKPEVLAALGEPPEGELLPLTLYLKLPF